MSGDARDERHERLIELARRAEASARLYGDLVKHTPSAVFVFRLDDEPTPALRLVSANPAAATILGEDPPVGGAFAELFADLAALTPALHALARADGAPPDVTRSTVLGPRHYAFNAFSLPGGGVGVTLEDVSEREQAQGELRANQLRLQAILDAANEAIFVIDEGARIESVNPACARIFGRPEAQLVGSELNALFDEPSQARLRRGWDDERRATADGKAPPARNRLELVARRADGLSFPIEVVFGELRLPDRLLHTAVMRDLSDRKEIERMKSEFVSTVSHELRTPLTSIRGSLGLIEGGVLGELPAAARELIQIARSNTDRLIRLINDILDLDKMDAGRLELQLRRIETRELVATSLDAMRGLAAEADVQLVAEVAVAGALDGDHDRLVQVLTNLLSNAVKFSPAQARVVVRVDRSLEGALRFSVSDAGPGIAADQLPKLFGKFQQLDASDRRQRGGTGLGLAICKAIVEHHGGTIGVFSKPGRGSTFWFDLPAIPSTSSLNLIDDATRHTVLLVDADSEVYAQARSQLARQGFRLLRASSLAEARRFLERTTPSVVVLDPRLPDGDGMLLARQLTLPVVITSRAARTTAPRDAAEVVAWLHKPVDAAELTRAIRRAVRRTGPPRVLIVDADPSTRALLGVQLRPLGVHTSEARDGVDAIRLARAEAPDLIILEAELPNGDGFEVVDVLRQERQRITSLIVYTGRELSAGDRESLTLGATRHLTKARSSESQLVAAVRELLGDLVSA